MSWANDLNKLCTKGGLDLGLLSTAIKVEVFSGIVSDTRVKTGRLRGNWQITEQEAAQGEVERLDKDGSVVADEIVKNASSDGLTYFVNNLPYAAKFEDEDGMVNTNIAKIKNVVKEQAAKIK